MKMAILANLVIAGAFWTFWFTPDQQGDRLFRKEQYAEAAQTYRDPMRAGVAWYRAGEFEKAEQSFARSTTPEAEYNRGNCLVFLGKYEAAIQRYDRALEWKPNWEEAELNRRIAVARAEEVARTGGEMGDQKIGADKVVFDKNKKPGGQDTESKAGVLAGDQGVQSQWLQRMQTTPADFLKAKFSYQEAMGMSSPADETDKEGTP